MGRTEKQYCDWNGEELVTPSYKLSLFDLASGPVETVRLDLCGACYSKWQTMLKARKDEIAAAWVLDPAAITAREPDGK